MEWGSVNAATRKEGTNLRLPSLDLLPLLCHADLERPVAVGGIYKVVHQLFFFNVCVFFLFFWKWERERDGGGGVRNEGKEKRVSGEGQGVRIRSMVCHESSLVYFEGSSVLESRREIESRKINGENVCVVRCLGEERA